MLLVAGVEAVELREQEPHGNRGRERDELLEPVEPPQRRAGMAEEHLGEDEREDDARRVGSHEREADDPAATADRPDWAMRALGGRGGPGPQLLGSGPVGGTGACVGGVEDAGLGQAHVTGPSCAAPAPSSTPPPTLPLPPRPVASFSLV